MTGTHRRRDISKADLVFNQIHPEHADRQTFVEHGAEVEVYASPILVPLGIAHLEPVEWRNLLADVPQLLFDLADVARSAGMDDRVDILSVVYSFWRRPDIVLAGVTVLDARAVGGQVIIEDVDTLRTMMETRLLRRPMLPLLKEQPKYLAYLDELLSRLFPEL